MATLKAQKPAADAIYIAITSFVTAVAGGEVFVREGDRLRGDHPAVKRQPQLFALDGSSDAEIHQHRQRELVAPMASREEATARAERAEREKHEPLPIPVARRLRVRQGFSIGFGRDIPEGRIVDREDKAIAKVVREYPSWFEEVGRPLA